MAEKEYIDKETVLKHFDEVMNNEFCDADFKKAALGFSIYVSRLAAADVAPVKHGRWIDWGGFGSLYNGFIPEYKCSVCNSILHSKRSYCGNCGARMDGGEQK